MTTSAITVQYNYTSAPLPTNKFHILDVVVGLVMGITVQQDTGGFVKDKFYAGSTILQPLTNLSKIPIDQLNFVCSSFAGILFGLFMRFGLPPNKFSVTIRCLAEITIGFVIVTFCYGMQIRVLILQSFIAYLILYFCQRDRIHTAVGVTVWLMLYLMVIHLCRLYYDYEGYTLDISGAIMLQTQRLSSLAFNLYDGERLKKLNQPKNNTNTTIMLPNSKSELIQTALKNGDSQFTQSTESPVRISISANSREYAVYSLPNPLEFAAYSIYFHAVCIGPFMFYRDYRNYLQGYKTGVLPQINIRRVIHLFLRLLGYGLLYAFFFQKFPISFITTIGFQRLSLISQIFYLSYSFFIARLKYYFGWCLAEAMGICAGNGFTGNDEKTDETLWKNVYNFNFFNVETAVNLKILVDSWNIGTVRWLREVVYIRVPRSYGTVAVFVVSAFWHGLYPGYYLMFLTFALFTLAARNWRRHIRSLFTNNRILFVFYDTFTIILTHLSMEYAQAPFHLLGMKPSLILWSQVYFLPHIVAMAILYLTPMVTFVSKKPQQLEHKEQKNVP